MNTNIGKDHDIRITQDKEGRSKFFIDNKCGLRKSLMREKKKLNETKILAHLAKLIPIIKSLYKKEQDFIFQFL